MRPKACKFQRKPEEVFDSGLLMPILKSPMLRIPTRTKSYDQAVVDDCSTEGAIRVGSALGDYTFKTGGLDIWKLTRVSLVL